MGAWIETWPYIVDEYPHSVAPLVGAWIETLCNVDYITPSTVAPLVGAWIETNQLRVSDIVKMSHPSWVRGLKQISLSTFLMVLSSHPSWVRGLKLGGDSNVFDINRRTPRGCVD